ncbi:hypothetical protein D3C78_1542480 [compost metagenome]
MLAAQLRFLKAQPVVTAQMRLNTGNEHERTKRFGNIFVRPDAKACNFVDVLRFCRQHNDGNVMILSDFHTGLNPVHLRHHNVQNNQIDTVILKKLKCL